MGGQCAAVAWFDGVLASPIVKGDDEAHGEDVGGKAASFSSYHAAICFLHCLYFIVFSS
jgi:hypothetical protein